MGRSRAWAIVACLIVTLPACSAAQDAGVEVPFSGPLPAGEGAVNVLASPGYGFKDAETEQPWVTDFEADTGCAVNLREVTGSDEAVALMETGSWDVVSAAGDASVRLMSGDQVQPLNTSLVPSSEDIYSELASQSWNSADGYTYGVAMTRSADKLIYNTKQVDPAPKSWELAYSPDPDDPLTVSVYDNPISLATAAIYLMGTRPDLAISDPYSLDATQFEAAVALATGQRDAGAQYWTDYPLQAASFKLGEASLGMGWQVTADLAAGLDAPVKATKPQEGTTGRIDSWMLATDAHNLGCSYRWIEWMTSAKVNADVAQFVGAAPANAKACDETKDEDYCKDAHADDPDYWQDVHFLQTPTEQCLDGRTVECTGYSKWVEAWTDMRAQAPVPTESPSPSESATAGTDSAPSDVPSEPTPAESVSTAASGASA